MFGHGAGSDPQVHHVDSEELYEMTESFKICVIAPNQEMSLIGCTIELSQGYVGQGS